MPRWPGSILFMLVATAGLGAPVSSPASGARGVPEVTAEMVSGDETVVERYEGCTGVDVKLWTMEGCGHIPSFTGNWARSIWEFMAAHPKEVA